jgi:GDP-4-dehydro-6-deoxy-D-mannose reductase
MKVLVTGADGFVGRHMVADLTQHGHDVVATSLAQGVMNVSGHSVTLHRLDITNPHDCNQSVQNFNPDAIIHLAGLAHTKDTENNLPLLFDVNVAGVSNIAHAMRGLPSSKHRSLLVISSAFVYGGNITSGSLKCNEESPLHPRGSYGQSKLAAESTARIYDNSSFRVYIARPFNHIGPGQDPSFVVAGFAKKISAAKDGDVIETGSLEAKRDFTDVRDVVRGYRLIVEKRPAERTFVFGSGKSYQISDVFGELCRIAKKNLSHKVRPDLLRTGDSAEITADPRLAENVLGWRPEITIETSLRDTLNQH